MGGGGVPAMRNKNQVRELQKKKSRKQKEVIIEEGELGDVMDGWERQLWFHKYVMPACRSRLGACIEFGRVFHIP